MKCVSLFSGCGGLDLGLHRAGFRVVFANDSDKQAIESFRANFPGTPTYLGSVLDLANQPELIAENSGGVAVPGAIDLLAGGPPCPPFSKSRFYRLEKPRALEDPVAKVTLGSYLRVLGWLRPRAFLLENVWGLGYRVHREALEEILSQAQALGYQCSHQIVNAADYGVPQIRQRLLILGMLDHKPSFPPATHAKDPVPTLFGENLSPWTTAGDAIDHLDTDENGDDAGHRAGGQFHDVLERIPPGQNYLYFSERGEGGMAEGPLFRWRSRYWSFLLKLSPNLPSWTIQATRSNNMGPFHWRNRILRIEEVKALQTFPTDWKLAGNVGAQWRQIGNAVPPLLAEHFGRALIAQLEAAHERRAAS